MRMRIGLFGGTFNPIHFGHLRAALEVRDAFPLDQCYLIPAAIPPHKRSKDLVAADARLDMIQMAIDGIAGMVVSDIELKRPGPSYTIDTVEILRGRLPRMCELYWILGLDAFLEIHTWKSYRKLLKTIPFIVTARPGAGEPAVESGRRVLADYLNLRMSAGYTYSDIRGAFVHPCMPAVFVQNVTLIDVSSTKIRELVRAGRSINFLVPAGVEALIRNRGLYL
jgi:nicotinate-nucleotide adenylyltransferase